MMPLVLWRAALVLAAGSSEALENLAAPGGSDRQELACPCVEPREEGGRAGVVWRGERPELALEAIASLLAPYLWYSADEPLISRGDVPLPHPHPCDAPSERGVLYYQVNRLRLRGEESVRVAGAGGSGFLREGPQHDAPLFPLLPGRFSPSCFPTSARAISCRNFNWSRDPFSVEGLVTRTAAQFASWYVTGGLARERGSARANGEAGVKSWSFASEVGVKFRARLSGRRRIFALGYEFAGLRLGVRFTGFNEVTVTRMVVEIGAGVW